MHGLFLLGSNYLVTSIVLCCMMIFIIDKRWDMAAFWSLIGGVCSLFGLMHNIKLGFWVKRKNFGWRFCVAYASCAALFMCLHLAQRYNLIDPPRAKDEKYLDPDNDVIDVTDERPSITTDHKFYEDEA
mmetsp:Transcript_681/g.979  ORF Transcript_681/g.979 Transcript_681/m.979 type:complete len:129 (-) Transcript_681:318-704(-)